MKKALPVIAALAATTLAANAGVIVDTLPANNQANMSADAGQTFTTPVLGLENVLITIDIEGPQAGATATAYTLELWTDTDGDHSTWDPGALLGSSTSSSLSNGVVTTYSFLTGPVLSDSTVYAFTYTDGAGTRIAARMGLTNADAIGDGTLFSAGGQVFGDAFDTAMRITTDTVVPEPSTFALAGLGIASLLIGRRRNA